MAQFLKRHSPVSSAMFWVGVIAQHFSLSPRLYLYSAFLFSFFVQEILRSLSFLIYFCFCMQFSAASSYGHVRYSYDASRLLGTSDLSVAVNDLFPNKKMDETDKVSLSLSSSLICCFAGKEDELVVSSKDKSVFVWQLPSVGQGHRTIESPLLQLDGHQSKVSSFSYNKNIGVLVSSDKNGVGKLWVPNESN